MPGDAAAENFDFEIGVTYNRTQLDAEQTITTNVGSIFNSNDIDTDAWSLFGSWYFAGLSDDNGPRARAAFVDRASMLGVSYARVDVSASASLVSSDPAIPSFEGSFNSDGDAYALDVRYVWRDSGWFANGGVAQTDTTIGGFVASSVDSTVWRVGVGKYLFDTTTLALDVSQADDDGGERADRRGHGRGRQVDRQPQRDQRHPALLGLPGVVEKVLPKGRIKEACLRVVRKPGRH